MSQPEKPAPICPECHESINVEIGGWCSHCCTEVDTDDFIAALRSRCAALDSALACYVDYITEKESVSGYQGTLSDITAKARKTLESTDATR